MAGPANAERFVNFTTGDPLALADTNSSNFGASYPGLVPSANGAPSSAVLHADGTWGPGASNQFGCSFSAIAATNALTISVLDNAGNTPSASHPVSFTFIDSTVANSAPVTVTATAALQLTLPNGASLETVNNIAFRIWLVVFNDAGTLRLGAINCYFSGQIFPLDAATPASSTTVSAGATSAGVFYTNAGVTAKAFTIIGCIEYPTGLATAGAWSANPTIETPYSSQMLLPGSIVQRIQQILSAVNSGSTGIPSDDTIPQNTEGNQFFTQAITPKSAANALFIEHIGLYSSASVSEVTLALFQDSGANAIAATANVMASANGSLMLSLSYIATANLAVSTTFNLRAGNNTATLVTLNGISGARLYGGIAASSFIVSEIVG